MPVSDMSGTESGTIHTDLVHCRCCIRTVMILHANLTGMISHAALTAMIRYDLYTHVSYLFHDIGLAVYRTA